VARDEKAVLDTLWPGGAVTTLGQGRPCGHKYGFGSRILGLGISVTAIWAGGRLAM